MSASSAGRLSCTGAAALVSRAIILSGGIIPSLRFTSVDRPLAAPIKTEIGGILVSIASFLRPVRSENGRPARDFGPDKTVECSRVALGLGWYRAAELGQSLAYIRLIKGLVEGICKLGDHLGRGALGRKQPGPDAHFDSLYPPPWRSAHSAALPGARRRRQHRP